LNKPREGRRAAADAAGPAIIQIALAVPVLIWAVKYHLAVMAQSHANHFNDFGRFYYSVKLWESGASLYGPSPATWLEFQSGIAMHLWNLNPPHFSLLVWPFAQLGLEPAYAAWMIANGIAFAVAAYWIAQVLAIRMTAGRIVLLLTLALASAPALALTWTGQFSGLLALLITWVWLQMRAGRWERAAIGIGVALSVKMFFVSLLAYLVWKRQWRAAAVAVATGVGCFAVGWLVFGWAEHVAWVRTLLDVQWPWLAINMSIEGLPSRIAFIRGGEQVGTPALARAVWIGILIAAPVALAGLIIAGRDGNRDRGALLILVTTLLTFPVGWLYYWWVVIGPLAACYHTQPTIRRASWWSLPCLLIPVAFVWPLTGALHAVTIGSLYFWSLLVLWIGAVRGSTAARREDDPLRRVEARA
jgi:alpha-1,2-mannosyltransferase